MNSQGDPDNLLEDINPTNWRAVVLRTSLLGEQPQQVVCFLSESYRFGAFNEKGLWVYVAMGDE